MKRKDEKKTQRKNQTKSSKKNITFNLKCIYGEQHIAGLFFHYSANITSASPSFVLPIHTDIHIKVYTYHIYSQLFFYG